jgi:hypothetical protein
MPHFELSPAETRILGCLIEKERLTPENYPLSPNGILTACNQSTNREPVVSYDEHTVDAGLTALRGEKLATMIHSSGARVPKYRHNLSDHYDLKPREVAVLCVLMLRGPQTPGELRQRCERMHTFGSLDEVETTLTDLAGGDDPLVRVLPARPGQKERRYVQLLTGEPSEETLNPVAAATPAEALQARSTRTEALEGEVAALRGEVQQLREELASFRKQFE